MFGVVLEREGGGGGGELSIRLSPKPIWIQSFVWLVV